MTPRAERAAAKLARLGARPVLELLLEIGRRHDCVPEVLARLEDYARLDPGVVRAVGADRFAPRLPRLVPLQDSPGLRQAVRD